MGGVPAQGGGLVRRGRLFRAGTLAHLGKEDDAALVPLGIRTICDLRRAPERTHEPSRWPGDGVTTLHWDYQSLSQRLLSEMAGEDMTAGAAFDLMTQFYRGLPLMLAEAIRDIFATVAGGRVPLLFHCAAGKDRTGVVAGLLHAALGVPREIIFADYARSAELVDYEAILRADPSVSLGLARGGFSLAQVPEVPRAVLLASDARYLAAAFAHAEAQDGTIESFLTDTIGVSPATLAAVRADLIA